MEGADRNNRQTDPERKWIRLQEIGLCQFLIIPIMILAVAVASGGWTITEPRSAAAGNFIVMMLLFLISSGYCCFRIGYDKRCELRDQED